MAELGGKDDLNIHSALREPFEDGPSKEDVVSHTVPRKYHGTQADQQDMIVLGKKQVLRVSWSLVLKAVIIWLTLWQRNFKFITMIGFGSTVICSWEVILP